MQRIGLIPVVLAAACGGLASAHDFPADVVDFLDRHCVDCHSGPDAEMGFRLDDLRDEATVLTARPRWRKILSRVAAGEMPPPEAERPVAAAQDAFLTEVRAAFARADAAPPDPGPTLIRRLSRVEYDRTIHDLFETDFEAGAAFPADGVGYGFTNIADVLTVSPLLMERYLDAADQVAAKVLPVAAPKTLAGSAATKAFLRADASLPPADRDRENLGRLATRAWRRPVEADVVAALVRLVDDAEAAGRSREDGLRTAIAAVLGAPEFVFRTEAPPPPESVGAVPVPDVELASRLSYFLWSSCPDEQLLDLAVRGELAANLDTQVRRMLADPRSGALVDEFAMQWLGLGRLEVHGVDADQFPLWRRQLSAAMVEETRRFVGDVFRADGSLLALLDADFTWVNHSLATLYALDPRPPLRKDEWRRVTFAPGLRSGLLTQAAILTVTSNPARTSPVKRGKWILETLLGDPPPMAPADVPSIEDTERRQLTGTFRQRMEQHRSDPRCAGCHRRMDAFGFALEEFNPIGQRRTQDEGGLPIDTSADIGGRRIDGLAGLKGYLLEHRADFVRCLATKMLIYALGRGLDPADEAALTRIERAVAASDHRFSSLIHAVVHSVPFRMRRGAAQEFAARQAVGRTTTGDTP